MVWVPLTEPIVDPARFGGVVADLRADLPAEWVRFLAACALAGLPVFDIRQIRETVTGRVEFSHLSDNTLGATLHGLTYSKLKRTIDLLLALGLAPLVFLVLGISALLIRLEDGGPVLFNQVRMGHRGRPFTIYKLRTMRIQASPGDQFTRENDPRITRVGKHLRRYRIDELPQIRNVLKGDMSWIGAAAGSPEAFRMV
jgi:lipopolysaccharide/colanic/teichoic acid biosynthesis glycosyltransferase